MLLPHFSALGAGPLVLMLHGAAGGYRSFAPQVERYACEGYRAVAWDMPGYGLSAPVEPYGVRGLAQSCVQLIEALLPEHAQGAARSAALIGHGLGGMVAQEVVMRRPDLVNRLVLSGSTSGPESGWAVDAHDQLQQLDGPQRGSMRALAEVVLVGQGDRRLVDQADRAVAHDEGRRLQSGGAALRAHSVAVVAVLLLADDDGVAGVGQEPAAEFHVALVHLDVAYP